MTLEEAFARVRLLPTRDHSPEDIARIKAGGRVTCAGCWDNLRPDIRAEFRPDLNPNKRWYEQKAWEKASAT